MRIHHNRRIRLAHERTADGSEGARAAEGTIPLRRHVSE